MTGVKNKATSGQAHEVALFQINVDNEGRFVKIFVPFSIDWESKRGARRILRMMPKEAQAEEVRLSGIGASKVVGSDIIQYRDLMGMDINEDDPRVVEVLEP